VARFYADLTWLWRWTTWARERIKGEGYDWIVEEDKKLNAQAELFVMGGRYDRVVGERRAKSMESVLQGFSVLLKLFAGLLRKFDSVMAISLE